MGGSTLAAQMKGVTLLKQLLRVLFQVVGYIVSVNQLLEDLAQNSAICAVKSILLTDILGLENYFQFLNLLDKILASIHFSTWCSY